MNITTATPAQIDTDIARLHHALALHHATTDQITDATTKARDDGTLTDDQAARNDRLMRKATKAVRALESELRPLFAEFARRGQWARYYLVTGGHLHHDVSTHRCSRTPTTSHYWMTELSGMPEAEVIEMAGDRVCTVCYPAAPVAVRNQPSQLLTPAERLREEARQARAAARDAKATKKAAAAIAHPDGAPLLDNAGHTVETEQIAKIEYGQLATDIARCQDTAEWVLQLCTFQSTADHEARRLNTLVRRFPIAERLLEALAAKHGVTVEEERAAWTAKIAARVRKEHRRAAAYRAANRASFVSTYHPSSAKLTRSPAAITPADLAALNDILRTEADATHAQQPRYAQHWDTWTAVEITRPVRTKLGVAFLPGDVVLASPELDPEAPGFLTCYSRRNKIDTCVPAGSVRTIRATD